MAKGERAVRKFQMLNLYAVSQKKRCYYDSIHREKGGDSGKLTLMTHWERRCLRKLNASF